MDIDCPDCSGCDLHCDIPCKKRIQRTCDSIGCTTCGENGRLGRFFLSMLATTNTGRAPRRHRRTQAMRRVAAWSGVTAIRCYQRWISPRLPTRCRYVPTCSAYGIHAIQHYGLIRGVRLTCGRILRCTADVKRGTPDPVTPPGTAPTA